MARETTIEDLVVDQQLKAMGAELEAADWDKVILMYKPECAYDENGELKLQRV